MPSSFWALQPGTPVADRFGQLVGTVKRVLIAWDHFDGIVVETESGDRFVDAPEVRRITEAHVELSVALSDVLHPGPVGPPAPPGVHNIRLGREEMTDDDRAAAITQLKVAFVEDRIGIEDLEHRVDLVHQATQLHELEELVRRLP